MGLGSFFKKIGHGLSKSEEWAQGVRRQVHGFDDRYISAQADALFRALMIEQEKRDLHRQEVEDRAADRRERASDRQAAERLRIEGRAKDYARGMTQLDPKTGRYSLIEGAQLPAEVAAALGPEADNLTKREIAELNRGLDERAFNAKMASDAESTRNARERQEQLDAEVRASGRSLEAEERAERRRIAAEKRSAEATRKQAAEPTIAQLQKQVTDNYIRVNLKAPTAEQVNAGVQEILRLNEQLKQGESERSRPKFATSEQALELLSPNRERSLEESLAPDLTPRGFRDAAALPKFSLEGAQAPVTVQGGSAPKPIVQVNDNTGEVRHSLDGGRTWAPGPPR